MVSTEPGQLQQALAEELRRRALWLVDVRWWITPCAFVAAGIAYLLDFEPESIGLASVATLMLLYNTIYQSLRWRLERASRPRLTSIRLFIATQVILDVLTLLCVLPVTGGPESPFLIFVVFHVVFVSLLLSPRTASIVVALVCAGVAFATAAETLGLLSHHGFVERGQGLPPSTGLPPRAGFALAAFATVLALTAASTAGIATFYRRRITQLRERLRPATVLAERLRALVGISDVLHRGRPRDALQAWIIKLKALLAVRGVVVGVLDDDESSLSFIAGHDLTNTTLGAKPLDVGTRPILQRVLRGVPFVTGRATRGELIQLGLDIDPSKDGATIASIILYPLREHHRARGVLCAFSGCHDRFDDEDRLVFGAAVELLAPIMGVLGSESAPQGELELASKLSGPLDPPDSLDRAPNSL